jgi:hypothetical protein
MKFDDIFTKKGLLKIVLLALSILIWVYFYVASSVSLDILIIFDIYSIANTVFTTDFLLFLLIFPITSAIAIALSTKQDKLVDVLQVSLGIIFGFLLSIIFFNLEKQFLFFALLYLIAHIFLSILTYNKFKDRSKINSLSNYANSKIALLLTVCILILTIVTIAPAQQEYAEKMEAGIVNMFVGDDIENWLGTSFNIGKKTTISNIDYITSQTEYQKLKYINNSDVQDFLDFMKNFEKNISEKDSEQVKDSLANLDTKEIKNEVFDTIDSMPIMIIIKNFFAIIVGIILASIAQLYFSIAFSLVGLLYVYIFYKIFENFDN